MTNLKVFNPWSLLPSIFDGDDLQFSNFNNALPSIDMFEENGALKIKVQLPGYSQDNIDLSIEGDSLKITGKIEEEKTKKDRKYYMSEIRQSSFTRRITLPYEVDSSKAKAEFKNGTLEISLPKSEKIQPKAIKITTK